MNDHQFKLKIWAYFVLEADPSNTPNKAAWKTGHDAHCW